MDDGSGSSESQNIIRPPVRKRMMVAYPNDEFEKERFIERFPLGTKVKSPDKKGWMRVFAHLEDGMELVRYVTQKERSKNRRGKRKRYVN